VLILATTNYPEAFLGNLTNRPQRFDDKIEAPLPTGEDRKKLLAFFSKDKAPAPCLDFVASKKGDKFSTAHLKESVIRSAIYEKPLLDVLTDIVEEINLFEKAFQKNKRSIGFE
jgi:AAA+ superfamily predicted ATPase